MAEVNSSAKIVRFGIFEADLGTGELRKKGVRVQLQGQPFQVFAVLLENSGELVTREELRRRVWPEDTFVDFDHALNTAINKIRIALGDEADNPRFVETMPRRGYRFIAPVDKPAPKAPAAPGPVTEATHEVAKPSSFVLRMAIALLSVVVIAVLVLVSRRHPSRTTEVDRTKTDCEFIGERCQERGSLSGRQVPGLFRQYGSLPEGDSHGRNPPCDPAARFLR